MLISWNTITNKDKPKKKNQTKSKFGLITYRILENTFIVLDYLHDKTRETNYKYVKNLNEYQICQINLRINVNQPYLGASNQHQIIDPNSRKRISDGERRVDSGVGVGLKKRESRKNEGWESVLKIKFVAKDAKIYKSWHLVEFSWLL